MTLADALAVIAALLGVGVVIWLTAWFGSAAVSWVADRLSGGDGDA
jgi:hypothetical protein